MNESTTKTICHFSPCASLAALGVTLRQRDLFGPIRKLVRIGQKTVKHTPLDKLYDALIAMLAGAHGLVESTVVCEPMWPCKRRSDAAVVPSNRWCRRRWTLAPVRM